MNNQSNNPVRVLIVNKYFDVTGGVEDVVRQLSSMKDERVSVTVLACSGKKTLPGSKDYGRVAIAPTLFTFLRMPIAPSFFQLFAREAREADVIHVHMPFPFGELAIVLFKKILRSKKVVVTYHADVVKQRFLMPLYAPLVRGALRRADVIVSTSPVLIEQSPFLRPFAKKCVVVPSSLPQPVADYARTYAPFTYVLFVGRLVYYKGVTYLLEALKGLDVHCKIAGTGPDMEALKAYAAELGIEKNVTFLGYVSDAQLDGLYRGASAFAFPSVAVSEAFGLVQVAAMAHGLPVINTDLPTGVPWVARDGMEALTVHAKDSAALRAALSRLASDPSLREQLGTAGKLRYEDLFTLEHMLKNYADLYVRTAKTA